MKVRESFLGAPSLTRSPSFSLEVVTMTRERAGSMGNPPPPLVDSFVEALWLVMGFSHRITHSDACFLAMQ